MTNHILKISNRRITCSNPRIVANSVNVDALSIEADEAWDGCNIVLILGNSGNRFATEYNGEPLYVPASLLSKRGYIPVSIVGYKDDYRITTIKCSNLLNVVPSGDIF